MKGCSQLALFAVALFAWGCADSTTSPLLSSLAPRNAIAPPPDDCSVNPWGIGCTRTYAYDLGEGSCAIPCQTRQLGTNQMDAIRRAIGQIYTNDPECAALANYALTALGAGRVRFYYDDRGNSPYGDIHGSGLGPNDPFAQIHIASRTFMDSKQLTITMMHEAAHGYYNIGDEGGMPEMLAQSCYNPIGGSPF